MKPLLPLLAVAAALAGCAPTLPPRPEAAQLNAPAAWQSANPSTAPIRLDWWQQAGDEALNQLVAQALAHNLDVALAAARVQEARAQEGAARAALLPSVDASLGMSRGQTVSAFGKPSLSTTEQPQLTVAYELDLFGRVHDQAEAAHQSVLQSQYAQDSARLAVAAATVNGYATLRALDERLAVLQQTRTTREQSLQHAESRFAQGYTSQLEVTQARAELGGIAQQIPAVQAAIARQEHALSLLTGQPSAAIPRGKPINALALPAVNAEQPSELLRRRPDVAQAEAQLAATDAQLAVARKQFLPQIRLQASAGRVFNSLLADPINVWSIGGSLLAPLFRGGQLEGQFDAAQPPQRDEVGQHGGGGQADGQQGRGAAVGAFVRGAMRSSGRGLERIGHHFQHAAQHGQCEEDERVPVAPQKAALAPLVQHLCKRHEEIHPPKCHDQRHNR